MVGHPTLSHQQTIVSFPKKKKSLQQSPNSQVPKLIFPCFSFKFVHLFLFNLTVFFFSQEGLPKQIDEEHGQHWYTSDGHQRFKNNRQFSAPCQGSPQHVAWFFSIQSWTFLACGFCFNIMLCVYYINIL